MNLEEIEHAADSGKQELKPTAKAMAAEIEALQRDCNRKVNKVKNAIVSMKELIEFDDNASEVC